MALLNIQGDTITLANGIALPQVQEQSVLFVTRLKEVARLGDEITIAHVLLLKQAGWNPATKANFQGLEEWANSLYQGNKTLFSRFKSWTKSALGLLVEIRDKDEGTYGVIQVDPEADASALAEKLSSALSTGHKEGILMQDKPKKAPKASAGKGGSKNGAVQEVRPEQVVAESVGLLDALQGSTAEDLAEFMPMINGIIEHIKTNPNKGLVKDQLNKVLSSLNKSFTLGKVMAKAG